MATINLPFAASGTRRAPDSTELANGFPCGDADRELFNWLAWHHTVHIGNLVEYAGLTQSDSDGDQLTTAVRSGKLNYVEAGGTANALTATLTPALAANTAGLVMRVKIATANTGAATFNAGPGALPIVTLKGNTLEAGDLVPGSIVTLICTGTVWMLAGAAYSEFRFRLKADMDLYCRPDGNDNNDGLSNTAGGAFRHPQAALASLYSKYDAAGRSVTIHLADGTYSAVSMSGPQPAPITIVGNTSTPANVIIAGGAGNPLGVYGGASLSIGGVTFTGSGRVYVQTSATLVFTANCRIENGTGGVPKIHADVNSSVYIGSGITLNVSAGNAAAFLSAGNASVIIASGANLIAGSVTYSQATVVAASSASILVNSTWTGSPTGKRYEINCASVYTAGGGASAIPGTTAGSSTTNQYT